MREEFATVQEVNTVLTNYVQKIGMIGRLGSGIANVLHDGISKIPNEKARERLNDVVARGHEGFQRVVDGAKDGANRVNNGIEVAKDIATGLKQGYNNQIKPAIPALKVKTF